MNRSKEILRTAEEEKEKLITDSQRFSSEEAEKRIESMRLQARTEHDKALAENKLRIESLKETATKHMHEAIQMVFDSIIGSKKD